MDLVELKLVRNEMLTEFNLDNNKDVIYLSSYMQLSDKNKYINLLKVAISEGNTKTLEQQIGALFLPFSAKGKKRPIDAVSIFAEGEFNRYYIRGLCKKAIAEDKKLVIYRAKQVVNPRPDSPFKIGEEVNAKEVLEDLQNDIKRDRVNKVPSGPNSGLSVKFK
jgi:hypothetical protein